MRRTRSRHVGRSVVSGATTPNRNGLVMPGLLSHEWERNVTETAVGPRQATAGHGRIQKVTCKPREQGGQDTGRVPVSGNFAGQAGRLPGWGAWGMGGLREAGWAGR